MCNVHTCTQVREFCSSIQKYRKTDLNHYRKVNPCHTEQYFDWQTYRFPTTINTLSFLFLSLRSKEILQSSKSKSITAWRQHYKISGLSNRRRGAWHSTVSKLLRVDRVAGYQARSNPSRKGDLLHGAGLSLHLPIVSQTSFVCCTSHPGTRRDAEESNKAWPQHAARGGGFPPLLCPSIGRSSDPRHSPWDAAGAGSTCHSPRAELGVGTQQLWIGFSSAKNSGSSQSKLSVSG